MKLYSATSDTRKRRRTLESVPEAQVFFRGLIYFRDGFSERKHVDTGLPAAPSAYGPYWASPGVSRTVSKREIYDHDNWSRRASGSSDLRTACSKTASPTNSVRLTDKDAVRILNLVYLVRDASVAGIDVWDSWPHSTTSTSRSVCSLVPRTLSSPWGAGPALYCGGPSEDV